MKTVGDYELTIIFYRNGGIKLSNTNILFLIFSIVTTIITFVQYISKFTLLINPPGGHEQIVTQFVLILP